MSGKNWLERDPQNSPGLQKVQGLNKANEQKLAEALQSEFQRKQREDNFRTKLVSQVTVVEQRTIEIKPLLEEARDFANRTGSFPISVDPEELVSRSGESLSKNARLELIHPHIVRESKIIVAKGPSPRIDFQLDEICKKALPGWSRAYGFRDGYNSVEPEPEVIVELVHGYKGTIVESDNGSSYNDNASGYYEYDASIQYGIRIRATSDGKIELLRQDLVDVPPRRGFGGSQLAGGKAIKENWITLPNDNQARKQLLAEAFHNPSYLGAEKFYIPTEPTFQSAEPQVSVGIGGLVKGFLGIK